ncbi:MAG: DMT family transporter, partial [Candidatus Promineifilaceae bacterium]|nr:DMT family transporter [Candidatus Promineifilaceae bacterium]
GFVLFGERIATVELAGILLAVAGVAWVVTEPRRKAGADPDRDAGARHVTDRQYGLGLRAAGAGAVGPAANLIKAKYGLVGNFPPVSATVIRLLIAVVILWGLTVARGQVRETVRLWGDRQAFRALIAGTVSGPFIGVWLSLVAIQMARLGIASTLMALPPVILIPVEYLVYRTPLSTRAIAGTLVAFAGVALILLL